MSYNITAFKVKKLDNLKIPVSSLFKHSRTDWHPEGVVDEEGNVTFLIMETTLSGTITGNLLAVDSIRCHDEGSGTAMHWILVPAFKDSTGEFIASCVWEGGDSINRLIVKDGDVAWEDIDI